MIGSTSGRFFGWVIGGTLPVAIASTAMNTTMGRTSVLCNAVALGHTLLDSMAAASASAALAYSNSAGRYVRLANSLRPPMPSRYPQPPSGMLTNMVVP